MIRRRPVGIGLAAAVVIAFFGGGITAWQSWRQTPRPSAPDTLVIVPRGASSGEIAAQLAEAGVLQSPRVFLWGLRLGGADEKLRAGRYCFARPSAPARVLTQLREGETEKVWLTLPEGL